MHSHHAPDPPASTPGGSRALALLAVAQFMVVLDVTVVNVALPVLGADLGLAGADLQWAVTAYTLAFGGLLLLGGRAADLLGRRRTFVGGLVVFTGASLVAGLATSAELLLAARTAQGVGAAVLSPAALSLIAVTFAPGPERHRASRYGARSGPAAPRWASCSAGCSPRRSAGRPCSWSTCPSG